VTEFLIVFSSTEKMGKDDQTLRFISVMKVLYTSKSHHL